MRAEQSGNGLRRLHQSEASRARGARSLLRAWLATGRDRGALQNHPAGHEPENITHPPRLRASRINAAEQSRLRIAADHPSFLIGLPQLVILELKKLTPADQRMELLACIQPMARSAKLATLAKDFGCSANYIRHLAADIRIKMDIKLTVYSDAVHCNQREFEKIKTALLDWGLK